MITALSTWWTVGWVVGAVVVVLVAVLILAIAALARRVDRDAVGLVADLDSIAGKTRPLHDVGRTNLAVVAITRGLRVARGQPASVPSKYRTSPGWRE